MTKEQVKYILDSFNKKYSILYLETDEDTNESNWVFVKRIIPLEEKDKLFIYTINGCYDSLHEDFKKFRFFTEIFPREKL